MQQNFFANVKALSLKASASRTLKGQHNHDQAEKDLLAKLFEAQIQLHAALCDSFDTPTALEILCDLVSTANVYINSRPSISNTDPLEAVALWVTRILRIFGLGEGPGTSLNGKDQIGWGELSTDESSAVNVRVRRLHACSHTDRTNLSAMRS